MTFLITCLILTFQDNHSSHDLNTLVPGQSHETISVSDNVGGHKNKESSNDGEPTATEKYSTETAEKYLADATGPGVSVSPMCGPDGVKHNDTGNNQPEESRDSLEVRKIVI